MSKPGRRVRFCTALLVGYAIRNIDLIFYSYRELGSCGKLHEILLQNGARSNRVNLSRGRRPFFFQLLNLSRGEEFRNLVGRTLANPRHLEITSLVELFGVLFGNFKRNVLQAAYAFSIRAGRIGIPCQETKVSNEKNKYPFRSAASH